MKKLLTIVALVALVSSFSFSQSGKWSFVKNFPDTVQLRSSSAVHGIVVSPDSKVWAYLYASGTDSVADPTTGVMTACNPIFVYNPDGTHAAIGNVKTATLADGTTDIMNNMARGLTADKDGNIYSASYNIYYKFDYKTGKCLNKVIPSANSLCGPGIDNDGNLYSSHVAGDVPAEEYASDFSFIGNDVDDLPSLGRVSTVSADGLTVIYFRFSPGLNLRYTRPDKFSSFVLLDSLFQGTKVESCVWHPKSGDLWFSSGSGNDNADGPWINNTWYAYSFKTKTITDSITWIMSPNELPSNQRPRGIAFTPSGDTAYVGCFGAATYPPVQMFTRPSSDVKKVDNSVVKSFDLSQNYPNPFNPSTEIKFSVPKNGVVSIKVYSILGQEVATLVNRDMAAGTYTTNFNASKLASGTYIYQIKANGFTASKKMLLMK